MVVAAPSERVRSQLARILEFVAGPGRLAVLAARDGSVVAAAFHDEADRVLERAVAQAVAARLSGATAAVDEPSGVPAVVHVFGVGSDFVLGVVLPSGEPPAFWRQRTERAVALLRRIVPARALPGRPGGSGGASGAPAEAGVFVQPEEPPWRRGGSN